MKRSRIIALVLSLAVVAGQVHYSYMYCDMMKRSADPAMQQRCLMHMTASPTSPGSERIASPLHSMLRIVSKGMTDSFEQNRNSNETSFPVAVSAIEAENVERFEVVRFSRAHNECPPPDIVIQNLNLRI